MHISHSDQNTIINHIHTCTGTACLDCGNSNDASRLRPQSGAGSGESMNPLPPVESKAGLEIIVEVDAVECVVIALVASRMRGGRRFARFACKNRTPLPCHVESCPYETTDGHGSTTASDGSLPISSAAPGTRQDRRKRTGKHDGRPACDVSELESCLKWSCSWRQSGVSTS